MKKTKPLFVLVLLFVMTLPVMAQINRRDPDRYKDKNTPFELERQKEMEEKEKVKYVEKSVEKLKTDLQLDDLQAIAIKQVITDNVRLYGIILKKEESEEDKVAAINALTETTETKIKAYLNKEQIEKYDQLKVSGGKKPKKKNRATAEQSEAK